MGDLSAHFSRKELACRCCGRLQIDGRLIDALEDLRNRAGVPIAVHAGYRCPKHNLEVGGVPNSEHTLGWPPTFMSPRSVCRRCTSLLARCRNLPRGGIGAYDSNFLHVDVRGHRARWARVRGKYVGIAELVREPTLLAAAAAPAAKEG